MIRETLKSHYIGMNSEFRYRGEETTRIEALSDSCFALSIGLLLISTSSPTTFDNLIEFSWDLIPFGLCIALIMAVWIEHFKFFICYGFRNNYIVGLNSLLLFILLFYVYPLKFLARLLVSIYGGLFRLLFGLQQVIAPSSTTITREEMPTLMIIYGFGATAIFWTLMAMYRYALKKSSELELNTIEIFDTKTGLYRNLLMGSVPILSVLLAAVIPNPVIASSLSGLVYFLYVPLMTTFGIKRGKSRKSLLEAK